MSSKCEAQTPTLNALDYIEDLRADFKRVYIYQWGVDGWNEAIKKGSLPKWLLFSEKDLVSTVESQLTQKEKQP